MAPGGSGSTVEFRGTGALMVEPLTPEPNRSDIHADPAQFRVPLILLGVGLGGFVDGIVLHQILQWHHMLSDTEDGSMTTINGLRNNTLADGLFHAFAWLVVAVAVYMAFRTKRSDAAALVPSRGVVAGWLLVGWASFNLLEGLVDHHLLSVHHVRDDVSDPVAWDLAFLGVSAVLLVMGIAMVRRGRRSSRVAVS